MQESTALAQANRASASSFLGSCVACATARVAKEDRAVRARKAYRGSFLKNFLMGRKLELCHLERQAFLSCRLVFPVCEDGLELIEIIGGSDARNGCASLIGKSRTSSRNRW
jgi:hypothetical protein